MPDEKASPTQPHPPDSLRYARNVFKLPDDLIDFTPELRASRRSSARSSTSGATRRSCRRSSATPAVRSTDRSTVGTATNWPGGGYDPELHIALRAGRQHAGDAIARRTAAGILGHSLRVGDRPANRSAKCSGRATAARPIHRGLRARGRGDATTPPPGRLRPAADERGAGGGAGAGLNVQGLPMVKPPCGLLAAINLDRGELMWQTAHGDTPDAVRNHPLLRGMTIPKTGQAGTSGVGLMVTKTMVVMGDPQVTTTPEHPRGAMLRAYDKTTGKEVGAIYMPAPQSGSPMTYMRRRQAVIIVAVSGGNYSGEYIAFALPARRRARVSSWSGFGIRDLLGRAVRGLFLSAKLRTRKGLDT